LLINDILNIEHDFLLVLDDFHLVSSKEISKITAYLLDNIPGNIHIVISTRSDPTLPMARLRSQHQLVEIRSSELSFSASDISVMFNKKLKLGLSIEDVNSLETKTEGWIAGLQLAALSIQGRDDISEFINEFKGDNRYIMDYLIEEVLKNLTDDIKEFLLHTSILGQISAPLCNAVLNRDDSQMILEELEKHNMFVFPLDSERNWYRYHHLFADLLKQRLLLKGISTFSELHNKACEWFEKNRMYDFAIKHALENRNYQKSINLLSLIIESMWESGQHSAILKYGDLLPDQLIKENPDFCLYYSWILITAGQSQKAEPFLISAEEVTRKIIDENCLIEPEIHKNKKLLEKISVAFAFLNSHKEHTDKIFDYCNIAMNNLTEDDPLWFSWAWFSYGIAYFSTGDLHQSNKAFNSAFEYGKKAGNIYLISTIAIRMAENEQQLGNYKSAYKKCSDLLSLMKEKGYLQITRTDWTYAALYFIMGVTQFIWSDIDKAVEDLKIAYGLCKSGRDVYLKIFVLMVYSIVLKELGNTEAEKRIDELDELIKQNDIPPFLMSMYVAWKVYLLIDNNQIELANNLILDYGLALNNEKNHLNETAYASYVRLLLVQYKLSEAEKLISELYALASAGKRIERIIELKISSAVLFKMRGDQEKAVTNMIEAMEIASEENLVSYFVINRSHINDIIKDVYKIYATTNTKISKEFIDKLKLAIERKDKLKKTHTETGLSVRELDTLKLIAEDMINQEIAGKLYISLNTVKTHVR